MLHYKFRSYFVDVFFINFIRRLRNLSPIGIRLYFIHDDGKYISDVCIYIKKSEHVLAIFDHETSIERLAQSTYTYNFHVICISLFRSSFISDDNVFFFIV